MIDIYSLNLKLTKGNEIKTSLEGIKVKISSIFALKNPKYLNNHICNLSLNLKYLWLYKKNQVTKVLGEKLKTHKNNSNKNPK